MGVVWAAELLGCNAMAFATNNLRAATLPDWIKKL
jgi:hypothetical protein